MRIGIDFDNTIAGYDHLFLTIAQERLLLSSDFRGGKKSIRDAIRKLPDGELRWMELQAAAYGARMAEAEPIEGVEEFLLACYDRRIPVHIVSHKTRFAARDPQMVDLHGAARAWLVARGFFGRLGVDPGHVFFESTREEKCRRIGMLACSHFIDDLEEVFCEPAFPEGVARYLLNAEAADLAPASVRAFRRWRDIQHDLLGNV